MQADVANVAKQYFETSGRLALDESSQGVPMPENTIPRSARRLEQKIVLGDENGWIYDQKRDGITGVFEVVGGNQNGGKVIDFFCEETVVCGSNTFFGHKSIQKYKRVWLGIDGIEVKSKIDFVLMKMFK